MLPEPLAEIFNRVLTDMKTEVLIKMDICIPAATFKVVSIEPYESMLLVGEPRKCAFLGFILALDEVVVEIATGGLYLATVIT